ncbi:MAG TPA: hypothetical protein VGG33_07480 [Polyangia bacterium]
MFLPLADPMPVGTRLEVRSPDETALVRVVKVTESADPNVAGVAVRPAGVAEPVETFPEYEGVPQAIPTATSAGFSAGHSGAARSSNGAGRPERSAPVPVVTQAAPQPVSPETSAPVPIAVVTEESSAVNANAAGEGESDETGSTSEYPALNNGAPAGKRRQRKRKAK